MLLGSQAPQEEYVCGSQSASGVVLPADYNKQPNIGIFV